jgi:putative ABC transport system permease protein
MGPGFDFPSETDVWLLARIPRLSSITSSTPVIAMNVIGRLRPGVPLNQGQSELAAVRDRMPRELSDLGGMASAMGLNGVNAISLRQYLVGDIKPILMVLLGAVVFVLLIACANVANLLVARNTLRRREIAIRIALGARPSRIARQLLTESALLSLIGGGAGLMLAVAGLRAFLSLVPAAAGISHREDIHIDGFVLIFTLAVSLSTALVFGLVPALTVTSGSNRINISESLNEGGMMRTAGPGQTRLSALMVVSEVAMAMVLLIGSGLMLKSFVLLTRTNVGFNPENVISMNISLPQSTYRKPEQARAFYERALQNIQSLPGVGAAAVVSAPPLEPEGRRIEGPFSVEGSAQPATNEVASKVAVSSDYFRSMGIPLLKGRTFSESDRADAPGVAVVSQPLADEVWPGQNPIGKRITIGPDDKTPREIIGVVADVKQHNLYSRPALVIYHPYLQAAAAPWQLAHMAFVIKTDSDPKSLVIAIRTAVRSADRDLPTYGVGLMDQVLAEHVSNPRFYASVTGALALLALVLVAAGVYGVISYSVGQRTQEIAIRVALGAEHSSVIRLFIQRGLMLAVAGICLGLAGAYGLTRFIASFLYRTTPTDVATFVGIAFLLTVVALLASYIPARRATRIDTTAALRHE